ncbi:efflux RND transporter periplasmic adaptor subunit [Magnetospirillum sp. 15-1]|uniref:efflux RND transporter periplasmic adaptor subunit n=1 Tax=Magnetospirillum sp. 15-1 TaxID=1979370 RepID=UPI000BBC8A4E|nr:efflux RND transporter periplasmic adaptor subunit [Magnetospirillum sp. 15-1]
MTDSHVPSPGSNPAVIRRKRLTWLAGGLVAAAAIGGIWTVLSDDTLRATDDAYVGGQVVSVTPQVSGTVIRILADNTDRISAGALLVEIDPTDAKVELASAEAQLAQAVRSVRGLYASDARFNADIRVRQADINKARADLAKARADFRERQSIAGTGAVSAEDVRHAADAVHIAEAVLASAEAALGSAEQARAQALAQVDGLGAVLDTHPTVQNAAQRVRAATLAVERTRIPAPVSGMVAQRMVQLGRRVAPGDRLMAVVPLDRLWVDANFKEIQLKGVCPGQPATVTADIYGKAVVYHGHVEDMEAGTGAAFALLPAQNATGNWIKVVQRVPVRIGLDPTELARNPLRIGMSAKVEINAGVCDPKLAMERKPKTDDNAVLYEAQAAAADTRVSDIVAANIGGR